MSVPLATYCPNKIVTLGFYMSEGTIAFNLSVKSTKMKSKCKENLNSH
jgi:hypothetical protein